MNRRRLKKLRNTLRDLRPCTDIRDTKMQTGYTGTVALTDTETLCTRASSLPPIDTLDMRVEHGVHDDGGSRQVLGCISAVAITMYPHQAAEAARILEHEVAHYDATDVAKEILGLDDEQAEELCLAHPEQSGQQRHPGHATASRADRRTHPGRDRPTGDMGPRPPCACTQRRRPGIQRRLPERSLTSPIDGRTDNPTHPNRHHMHEQRELPGGALGDAITTLNRNEQHWFRPATIGHDADPELKHTTVRWHTGPNGAADPTTGWYILSHANNVEPITARTGPVRTADNLYRRLFELHGADLDSSNMLTPASDQRDEQINRIIEEAHVQRLHEAADRWNTDVRKSLADDNARGVGVPDTHFRWQFSFDAMYKHDALRATFQELRSATTALRAWTES